MIIVGIVAQQQQYLGTVLVGFNGFRIVSSNARFAVLPLTVIEPAYANQLVMTQTYVEAIIANTISPRVTQQYAEVIAKRNTPARISQQYVEVIRRS